MRIERCLSGRKTSLCQYHYYLCQDTGEQFTTTELDELNINQLYNQIQAEIQFAVPG